MRRTAARHKGRWADQHSLPSLCSRFPRGQTAAHAVRIFSESERCASQVSGEGSVPSATCFHQIPRQVRRTHVAEQGPSRRCMGAARSYSRAGRHHKCSGQSLIQLCRERLPAALPVDVHELNQIVSTLTNAIRVCLQPAAMRDMTPSRAACNSGIAADARARAPGTKYKCARKIWIESSRHRSTDPSTTQSDIC